MPRNEEELLVAGRQARQEGRSWLDRELGIAHRRGSSTVTPAPDLSGIRAQETPASPGRLRKVLIVDDDEATTKVYRAILPGARYVVSTARTGEEGLERAKAWKPDLVILDYMLPGMDGVEVCGEIRNQFSDQSVKIMMVSGHSTLNDRVRGYGAGADDFLVKPVDLAVFSAKVETMFEWARKEQEGERSLVEGQRALHSGMNCWEFKKCGRDVRGNCPAYTRQQGRMCWLVAGTMCGGNPQGTYAQKIKNCSLCDFFQALKQSR